MKDERKQFPSPVELEKESHVVIAAANVARMLHQGQKDKGGNDYFSSHLMAVGCAGSTWKEKVVGFLHDAAEDTGHSVEEVVSMVKGEMSRLQGNVPEPSLEDWNEIASALNTLNHFTAPDRGTYIERFRSNKLAVKVKLNDMANNMDISRIPNPTPHDLERLERYRKEYEILRNML